MCVQPCLNGGARRQAGMSKSENEMANECAWRGSFTGSTCAAQRTPLCSLSRPAIYQVSACRCKPYSEPYRTCLLWYLLLWDLSVVLCSGAALRSTSDRISGDNYRLACKYAESIRFCLSGTTLVWNGTN